MVSIRKYKNNDLHQSAVLISKTFRAFNHKDNPQAVSEEYAAAYDPAVNLKAIRKRFDQTSAFFVAEDKGRIIGVLRAVENRIVNLFVDGRFHRKGIGKKLIRRYESDCRKQGYRNIVLRSQLYAVGFYEACGYKKTTGIRNKFGLKIQPMKKHLTAGRSG